MKGRVPVFGYPMMAYSPPGSGVTLTDRKAWRVGLLSGGTIEREERPQEVSAIIREVAAAKSTEPEAAPRQFFAARTASSPAGTKNHLYHEQEHEFTASYRSQWRGIFRGLGMHSGASQQIITELLESHDLAAEVQEAMRAAFQTGKKLEFAALALRSDHASTADAGGQAQLKGRRRANAPEPTSSPPRTRKRKHDKWPALNKGERTEIAALLDFIRSKEQRQKAPGGLQQESPGVKPTSLLDRGRAQTRLCEQRKLKKQQVTLAKILHAPPDETALAAAISSRE